MHRRVSSCFATRLQPLSSLAFSPKCCLTATCQLSAVATKDHLPSVVRKLASSRPTSASSVGGSYAAAAFACFCMRLEATFLKPLASGAHVCVPWWAGAGVCWGGGGAEIVLEGGGCYYTGYTTGSGVSAESASSANWLLAHCV